MALVAANWVIPLNVHLLPLTAAFVPSTPVIQLWVWLRLTAAVTSDITLHYEYSLYGPINILLSSIFPVTRRFMVKPQALLRRSISEDDHYVGDISIDSTNDEVQGRYESGHELNKRLPDFVIVKAGSSLNADTILTVVEVKRDQLDLVESILQLTDYLDACVPKVRGAFNLDGFLVAGGLTIQYRTRPLLNGVYQQPVEVGRYETNSAQFVNALHTIGMQNWN